MTEKSVNANIKGGRWLVLVMTMILATGALVDISINLDNANQLHKEDIKIKKAQLDLLQKQYALDSLRYARQSR